jgi:cyclohexanecarboxylate-CoA ligase
VVALRPGEHLELPDIVEFLKSHHVAMQYIPERLWRVDALPVTPARKIQKFRLRDALREAGPST